MRTLRTLLPPVLYPETHTHRPKSPTLIAPKLKHRSFPTETFNIYLLFTIFQQLILVLIYFIFYFMPISIASYCLSNCTLTLVLIVISWNYIYTLYHLIVYYSNNATITSDWLHTPLITTPTTDLLTYLLTTCNPFLKIESISSSSLILFKQLIQHPFSLSPLFFSRLQLILSRFTPPPCIPTFTLLVINWPFHLLSTLHLFSIYICINPFFLFHPLPHSHSISHIHFYSFILLI